MKKILPFAVGLILFSAVARRSSGAPLDMDLGHAAALQQSGKLLEARTVYQRVLESAKKERAQSFAAQALAGLAEVDLDLGRYSECLTEAAGALSFFRASGSGPEEARILTTRGNALFYSGDLQGALRDFERGVQIARASGNRESEITRLNNVGSVYYAEGRYGEALQRYQQALDLVEASPQTNWAGSRRQLTIANMAVLYQRIGQYDRALELYKRLSRTQGALPAREEAQMLGNMGTLYRRLGDPVKALEEYRAAQTLYHRSALLSGEVGVLNNIGIAQSLDFSSAEAAAHTFTEALRMAQKSGGKQLIMKSLLYRGDAFLHVEKLSQAGEDFGQARRLATDLNAAEERWRAEYGLARVAERQGDRARCDELLRDAVEIIEKQRNSAAAPSGRSGFLIERRQVYDLLIEHEAARPAHDIGSIFRLMEQSRARDLQDRIPVAAVGLEDLRRRIPADTLLLEYWLGAHSMAVVWISRTQAGLVHREISASGMAAFRDLPLALSDPKRRDWYAISRGASALLLQGIDALNSPDVRRLIVVPDAVLASIPFEALPLDAAPESLLIDRVGISYLPFAGAFRKRVEKRLVFPPWKRTLIAFADPVPGARGSGLDIGSNRNQRLPEAAAEVRSIAEAIGGRSSLHLGRDARKHYLNTGLAESVPVLHFATHAFADPEDPERSFILFAPENGQQRFDYLFLREAAALPVRQVSLITISACDSGSGRITPGEGVQSFGSTFLGAGARAVLTSLWRIGDRPSAELMTRFYESLAQGQDAAEALRGAKLVFRRSSTSAAHPAYWAAFILTGDADLRIPRVISWEAVIAFSLCAIALLLAGAFLFGRIRLRRIRTTAGTVWLFLHFRPLQGRGSESGRSL